MDILEVILLALANTVLMFFASFKFMQTLQQSGYDGRGYMSWLKRKDNIYMLRLAIVSILSVLAFLIFNIAIMIFVESRYVIYAGFAFYAVFMAVYIKKDRTVKSKVPLVKTARVKRLLITFVLISFLMTLLLIALVNLPARLWSKEFGVDGLLYKLRYGVVCLSPLLLPVTVISAFYVNEPFERYNKRKYVAGCTAALAASDVAKIGITGSYGKTSVKEILATILSEKFSVLATPYSYNTPMGICKTVKRLKPTHEVFIAEMGARNVGDIAELAAIVRPDIAVMTGITNQHIETFGSITNIKKTKYELIESMGDKGFAVFTSDNENTYSLAEGCALPHIFAGLDRTVSPEVYADGLKITAAGSTFTLHVGGQEVACSTVLIGTHNVSNICLAAAVAFRLGLTPAEIAAGINRLKPIKHRLETVPTDKGFTIIDDSFNSNVNGTIAAMEVLDHFSGRKIVITPGLVELGKIEDYENYELGRRLGAHADVVILVGKRRIDKINEGLISVDFPKENIHTVKDLDSATRLLSGLVQKGDVVIFENDLPDKYN